MIKFEAPEVRVYFNRANDAPKVWSVDFGADTLEIICAWVVMDAPGCTVYDPVTAAANGPVDVQRPRAWFEFRNVEVSLSGPTIYISRTKVQTPSA